MNHDQHYSLYADFIERMVAMANAVSEDLVTLPDDHARHDRIKQIVGDVPVVFAVWQDKSEHGVYYMLIKGQNIARRAIADNEGGWTRIGFIPCIDAEQADALLYEFGERNSLH